MCWCNPSIRTPRCNSAACIPPTVPAPKVPERSAWDLAECGWSFQGDAKRQALLTAGWEPFAVTNGSIWFRRQVPT